MAHMYSYPRVARCDPASIPLPGCMYRMPPIQIPGPQVTGTSAPQVATRDGRQVPESTDERCLRQVLATQERLLTRMQRIEDGLRDLIADEDATGSHSHDAHSDSPLAPHSVRSAKAGKQSDKKAQKRKSDHVLQSSSAAKCPADGHQAVSSILKRQEDLIQQIDHLTQTISQSLSVSPSTTGNTSPITRQKATDVSVFVEMGSSIDGLLAFFHWIQKEKKFHVSMRTHFHSSTLGHKPCVSWHDFHSPDVYWRTAYDLTVSLIVTKTPESQSQVRAFIDPKRGVVSGEKEVIDAIARKLCLHYKR